MRIVSAPSRAFRLIPGILLLIAVGYAGKFLEQSISHYGKAHHLTLPNIEYVLWAILIGLVLANTVGIPEVFRPGVATYEFWLKAGIVLLGARFLLADVLRLGGISLGLVAIEITISLTLMHLLGRVFGLGPKLTTLLAVGSSICGVSAIIATQGAIDAEEEDASYAIAAILALGAISLFTFPLIGHWLHLGDRAYGLWAGLAVDNTAEASAAGALYSDAAGKLAVLAKTTRNAMIGFVVLGYAIYWSSCGEAKAVGNKAAFLWQKFLKFVLGFLLISVLRECWPVCQTATYRPRQSVALGVSSYFRRSRTAHEYSATGQARLEATSGRNSGRSVHCTSYVGARIRSRPFFQALGGWAAKSA